MNQITIAKSLSPRTIEEAMSFASMLAKSTMVPKDFQGKPENIIVAIQWGAEVGLGPLQALQNIAVINGRPSIWGDAALALVQGSGQCEEIKEWIEGEGDARVAYCETKRRGRATIVKQKFAIADAKRANLWGRQGPWTQYPERMLQMRARSFALRDAYPDVLKGVILAEEAQDIPNGEPKNVTPQGRGNPLRDEFAAWNAEIAAYKSREQGDIQIEGPEFAEFAAKCDAQHARGGMHFADMLRDQWETMKKKLPERIEQNGRFTQPVYGHNPMKETENAGASSPDAAADQSGAAPPRSNSADPPPSPEREDWLTEEASKFLDRIDVAETVDELDAIKQDVRQATIHETEKPIINKAYTQRKKTIAAKADA